MATTVTTKGQVTIPKAVRDLLGLTPGSSVTFDVAEDGRVVLRKAGSRAAAGQAFQPLRQATGQCLGRIEHRRDHGADTW